jgi:hypothetical protein
MPIATIEVGSRVRNTKREHSWRWCIRSWVDVLAMRVIGK